MPDRMTPNNADLSLELNGVRHYFWIHGDTWHLCLHSAHIQVLEPLAEMDAYILVDRLLDLRFVVERCSRPFRSLYPRWGKPIPQTGRQRIY